MPKPPKPPRAGIEVEHTEGGMVIHLPDFASLRMKETAEFRASIRKPQPGTYPCSHWRRGVLLDSEQRTVHCRNCDAKLDPFDALEAIVKNWDRIRDDFTTARTGLADTRVRLKVLERLEKNTRERLKRMGINADIGVWWQRNVSDIVKAAIKDVQREKLAGAKATASGDETQ